MTDTTENNILIAEFMEFQKTNIGWYDYNETLPHYVAKNGNTHDELWFNDSWDWLMPVIQAVKERQLFGSQILIEDIDNALIRFGGIEEVYEYVITFINWYNENK